METKQPEQESKLPLMQQEKALAELAEKIHYLGNRISPVMTPETEDKEPGVSPDREIMSTVATQLHSNNSTVYKLTNIVNDYIRRVEC